MIPGLCVKVIRGLPLNRAEAAIWEEFHRRHSDEEVMTLIATMLAELMPAQAELLNSAIHTVSVPVQTPFPPSSSRRHLSSSVSVPKLTSTSLKAEQLSADSSSSGSSTPPTENPDTKSILKDNLKRTNSMFVRSLSMKSLQRDLRRCFSDIFTPSSKKEMSSKTKQKKRYPQRIRKVSVRKIQCGDSSHSAMSTMTAATCPYTEEDGCTTAVVAAVDIGGIGGHWKPAARLACSALHSDRRVHSCPPSPRNTKEQLEVV